MNLSQLKQLMEIHQKLLSLIEACPDQRHVLVNVLSHKKTLTLVLGLNFLRTNEIVEQHILFKAIQKYLPCAEILSDTFFIYRNEKSGTLRVEIQKTDHQEFQSDEIEKLKKLLPNDIENHIAHLLPPLFMHRNEEEIMRTILSLSQQIKYLKSMPQVFISFDEQTAHNLFFTVIVVRVLHKKREPMSELIRNSGSFLRYIHDRVRVVGALRQKYQKEATVFRVKFTKESFLRSDHSIDFYKARQCVVDELTRCIGEFRDFNGGMISKQSELLMEVKKTLAKEEVIYNEIILEDFFYSLAPVIMRTILEPHVFKYLFLFLLETLKERPQEKVSIRWREDNQFTYLTTMASKWTTLDEITPLFYKFQHSGTDLVQGYIKTPGSACMGYVFRSLDKKKQEQFRSCIESIPGSAILLK